ncbi:hypothetical protein [Spirillospora sp. CA-294931]|uniref:hypothetical protein n=1 Tax=Spirillospora sp. CA-294931 TaxID=3240042 RepID=UPI003D8E1C3F
MAPTESDGGVFISTKDIYEQFVKMNEQLARVNEELCRLTTLMTDTREEQADMEQRLRSVERWKYGIPIAYLGLLISFIAQFTKVSGKP